MRLLTKCIIVIGTFLCANVLLGQEFLQDFDMAKNQANKTDKTLMLIFSGSDWCKPCIQLRTSILEDDTFVDYAADNLVLVEVDFPYARKNRLPEQQRKHNQNLADKYNPKGTFPLVVLLDKSSNMITSFGYDKRLSPTEYVNFIQQQITLPKS